MCWYVGWGKRTEHALSFQATFVLKVPFVLREEDERIAIGAVDANTDSDMASL